MKVKGILNSLNFGKDIDFRKVIIPFKGKLIRSIWFVSCRINGKIIKIFGINKRLVTLLHTRKVLVELYLQPFY